VLLVDDLLDVSRITHGKIRVNLEPVDLRSALSQAIEIATPLISARTHRLAVSSPNEPIRVLGDLTRLTQVIANLLNNAAKYTDKGGQIWLTLTREADEATLCVRDSGLGLSPDMVERIFEPFIQVERSLERSEGGLGIGLTLARRLVEMHGGQLSARSDGPGHGSEFIIRLPVFRTEAQHAPVERVPTEKPPELSTNGDDVSHPSRAVMLTGNGVHKSCAVPHN
jgi:signal transduction histidine kinase